MMAVVVPSWAAPLTNVTSTTFTSWLGAPAAPPLVSTFDFAPTPPGPDGNVASSVFHGAGPVAGLYVYVYQIKNYSTGSESKVEGMSFDLFGPVALPNVLNPGTVAFQVIGTGDNALGDATVTPAAPPFVPYANISFSIPSPFLLQGEQTWLFGFFSPNPPVITIADVRDTGSTVLSPRVYTPSPEPSVIALFGLGVLGIFWRRKRLL